MLSICLTYSIIHFLLCSCSSFLPNIFPFSFDQYNIRILVFILSIFFSFLLLLFEFRRLDQNAMRLCYCLDSIPISLSIFVISFYLKLSVIFILGKVRFCIWLNWILLQFDFNYIDVIWITILVYFGAELLVNQCIFQFRERLNCK